MMSSLSWRLVLCSWGLVCSSCSSAAEMRGEQRPAADAGEHKMAADTPQAQRVDDVMPTPPTMIETPSPQQSTSRDCLTNSTHNVLCADVTESERTNRTYNDNPRSSRVKLEAKVPNTERITANPERTIQNTQSPKSLILGSQSLSRISRDLVGFAPIRRRNKYAALEINRGREKRLYQPAEDGFSAIRGRRNYESPEEEFRGKRYQPSEDGFSAIRGKRGYADLTTQILLSYADIDDNIKSVKRFYSDTDDVTSAKRYQPTEDGFNAIRGKRGTEFIRGEVGAKRNHPGEDAFNAIRGRRPRAFASGKVDMNNEKRYEASEDGFSAIRGKRAHSFESEDVGVLDHKRHQPSEDGFSAIRGRRAHSFGSEEINANTEKRYQPSEDGFSAIRGKRGGTFGREEMSAGNEKRYEPSEDGFSAIRGRRGQSLENEEIDDAHTQKRHQPGEDGFSALRGRRAHALNSVQFGVKGTSKRYQPSEEGFSAIRGKRGVRATVQGDDRQGFQSE